MLKKVITGDKSWVYDYDPETKPQLYNRSFSSVTIEKSLFKSDQCPDRIVFFDYESVVGMNMPQEVR